MSLYFLRGIPIGETEEIDENNLQIIHTKFPKIGVKNIEYSDSNED